jgi:hypothetical protein
LAESNAPVQVHQKMAFIVCDISEPLFWIECERVGETLRKAIRPRHKGIVGNVIVVQIYDY